MQEATPQPSDEEDSEFDFEDGSDHQDYDHNYFDNGEGDDDSGGEEDGECRPRPSSCGLMLSKTEVDLMIEH